MRFASVTVLLFIIAVTGCSDTTIAPDATKTASLGKPTGTGPFSGQVIATGLNNPRQMAFGPRGALFVTEAGLGAGNETDGVQVGIGPTASVTMISQPASAHPTQRRILTGLTSAGSQEGDEVEAIGPDGISFSSRGANGSMYLSYGGHTGPGLGLLVQYSLTGTPTTIADVGTFSMGWTADHADLWEEFPDANPYGMLATQGHLYVVDAAANTLNEVMANGDVKVLAYFPNYADLGGIRDAVPTAVVQGPDGALYIGTLALAERFAIGSGQAIIYRVDPSQTNPDDLDTILHVATPWGTGFDTITAMAMGSDGYLYATEMFGGAGFTGDVVRVPFGNPDQKERFGEGQVTLPTGIAAGPGGVYVSSFGSSTQAGQGQVVRFRIGEDSAENGD